ncbi:phosphopantetheine-binding protein [Oceanimonas sp. GK1]|uniref:acyl carrier protein n=1 Tax=Oceanimonas sp. (strain GK1 / IBRC-M 10197) TaxID=511062 RepID=UPI000249566C|nr:phosphopantetheine-binding protein [Oceanimonas sp. GK1]AEY02097.1 phosphopantetheine-binding protein [Oceanimonas sp. GK1]
MKDKQALTELVCRHIRDIAPDADTAQLDPDEDMRDALDLDSMDFLRLVEALGRELGILIPEADFARITRLSQMVDYLSRHTGKSGQKNTGPGPV